MRFIYLIERCIQFKYRIIMLMLLLGEMHYNDPFCQRFSDTVNSIECGHKHRLSYIEHPHHPYTSVCYKLGLLHLYSRVE
jgi:hypothetical protein